MELQEEDVIKFYELLSRYDKLSPNIGIIGNRKKFERIVKQQLKSINYDAVYSDGKRKYTFLKDEIEYTYIHIRDTIDLRGYKFRKFI